MGGFANPTKSSAMFWESLGFCFSKTGKLKAADEWNESGFGNYSHIMFSNVDERMYEPKNASVPVRIERAERKDLEYISEKYLIPYNEKYYSQHSDEMFGFAAFDNDNRIAGFVMMRYEMMFPPLDGIMIQGTVYVEPEMRRNGIGSTLVREAVKTAKQETKSYKQSVKDAIKKDIEENKKANIVFFKLVKLILFFIHNLNPSLESKAHLAIHFYHLF